MKSNIFFREITQSDYLFLRELLYEAIFIPEGTQPLPKSILDDPNISKYIENWGKKGDMGIIAFDHDKLVGAVWCRLLDEDHKGYGFVNSNTPELSMALTREYRNKGMGTLLINTVLKMAKEIGFNSISLSVDKRNRAANFYLKAGFKIVEEVETAYTMKIDLNSFPL